MKQTCRSILNHMLYLTVGWFQKVLSLEIWWKTVIGIGQMAFLCQIVSKNGVKQPMENQSLSQCFIQAVFNFELNWENSPKHQLWLGDWFTCVAMLMQWLFWGSKPSNLGGLRSRMDIISPYTLWLFNRSYGFFTGVFRFLEVNHHKSYTNGPCYIAMWNTRRVELCIYVKLASHYESHSPRVTSSAGAQSTW